MGFSTVDGAFFSLFELIGKHFLLLLSKLLLNLFFDLFKFKAAHFLDFTAACEVKNAVSIWHASKIIPHHLLNWDVFPLLGLVVEIRTQHFLKAMHVVAMACVDLNLQVFLFWVSFRFG